MKPRFVLAVALAQLLPGGCRGVQSALAPEGPQAAEIAALAWLLFGVAAIVMLVVLAAVWLAMHGSTSVRRRLADTSAVYAGGVAFPAVVLTGLLGYGLWQLRTSAIAAADPPTRIEVVGEQWWWRTTYVTADGQRVAGANDIRLPVGSDVELALSSADVIHSFWVPALAGKLDMIPGRTNRLRMRADRPGIYRGQCAEYCGGPHALMSVLVKAMPAPDYEAWLRSQAAPAAEPIGDAAARGRELFLSAGCGGCHAIRGTQARGSIGPDLTHVASRSFIGVDTLPPTQENLARFIVEGQHIKPGNPMPPFDIFAEEELDALSAYLAGLR